MRKQLALAAACLLLLCAAPSPLRRGARADAADRFREQVAAISAGANTAARRAAITKRLEEMGVRYCVEPFTHGGRAGLNVVAELPGASGAQKQLLLGAHYDRVSAGEGAVDNASGSAVVLELLAALKEKPLKNHRVAAAFFDLEEVGLFGSKEFVKARQQSKSLPAVYVNFDVFGFGDTLYLMAKDADAGAAASVKQAAKAANFPLQAGPDYPPSDHLSFLNAPEVETISFSLVPAREVKTIRQLLKGETPAQMPTVMTIIHTTGDTPARTDAAAVARSLPVVEQALRNIDARQQ